MVGPTASVPQPSHSRFNRPIVLAPGRPIRNQRFIGFLAALALLVPSIARAQGPAGGPIQQVGFGAHGSAISGYGHHAPVGPWVDGCCPEITYEYVPDDRFGLGSEHLAAFGGAVRSTWYRLEYLNWTIEAFGDRPLGAPRPDGNEVFDATDLLTGATLGLATQPDARGFDTKKNNGLRFTIGFPTQAGDLEASVFILEQADSTIRRDPFFQFGVAPNPNDPDPLNPTLPNSFAATVLTVDGIPSNSAMLLYSESYQASLKTDVFGTEANFVFNPVTPNQPILIQPMIGFQYVDYRENLLIAGRDVQQDPIDPLATITLYHRIDARSQNNVFAPQIGVRAQFIHEWFTIGVTPKFLLGFNRREELLRTSELILPNEPEGFDRDRATEFSPGFDLKVDARVHLNEHFSLFASYQLYVLSNISRPVGNINYDTIAGTEADFSLNTQKQHDVWIDGITVGGELRFH